MQPRLLKLLTAALVGAVAAGPFAFAGPGRADPAVAADPSVIPAWNVIAARTIFTENATPIPSSGLYFAFASVAAYDAVVTIEGRYQPYLPQPRPHANAAPEVAAVTATYVVLRHYFPASADNLTRDYEAAMARQPNGVATVHGKRVGEDAAAAVIAAREGDGRGAGITLNVAPAPSVWRPTPPSLAPMLVPWLGFVRPLALDSPTEVPLPGPDPIGSAAYARDFNEVRSFGSASGSSRTPAQTETALFYNYNSVLQYQEGMRDQVTRRRLDIVESSRAFALLGTATADAAIACWRAKYDYAYWRPITAIREADTDGNTATEQDPYWTPLVNTPPYGDYVSGHACITGAATGTLSHLFGAGAIDLNLFSGVTNTTRHYGTADAVDQDTMNARIWLGLHFRRAMTDGNLLGHAAANLTASRHFRPAT